MLGDKRSVVAGIGDLRPPATTRSRGPAAHFNFVTNCCQNIPRQLCRFGLRKAAEAIGGSRFGICKSLTGSPLQTLHEIYYRFSPNLQADWAEAFVALALSKPSVQGVQWTHFSDAEPHQYPNCGLVDASGTSKPALGRLRGLRERYLI